MFHIQHTNIYLNKHFLRNQIKMHIINYFLIIVTFISFSVFRITDVFKEKIVFHKALYYNYALFKLVNFCLNTLLKIDIFYLEIFILNYRNLKFLNLFLSYKYNIELVLNNFKIYNYHYVNFRRQIFKDEMSVFINEPTLQSLHDTFIFFFNISNLSF